MAVASPTSTSVSNLSVDGQLKNSKQKWYHESTPDAGEEFLVEIEEILYEGKTKYQDILIFKSKSYGNVLILDNVLQCTERDEYAYHEMMAFLPLLAHPHPKRVLIIGGGDGGLVREVVKHPQVESVVVCELDQEVIDLSKKFLPNLAKGFSSPKAQVYVGDGFEYIKEHKNEFDVILVDSSDNIGPSTVLYQEHFYSLVKSALKEPHGITCAVSGSMWLYLPNIKKRLNLYRKVFPSVTYAYGTIPSYLSGCIGFVLCSIDKDVQFTRSNKEIASTLQTRYYNSDIHRSAFVLPNFVQMELQENIDQEERKQNN